MSGPILRDLSNNRWSGGTFATSPPWSCLTLLWPCLRCFFYFIFFSLNISWRQDASVQVVRMGPRALGRDGVLHASRQRGPLVDLRLWLARLQRRVCPCNLDPPFSVDCTFGRPLSPQGLSPLTNHRWNDCFVACTCPNVCTICMWLDLSTRRLFVFLLPCSNT